MSTTTLILIFAAGIGVEILLGILICVWYFMTMMNPLNRRVVMAMRDGSVRGFIRHIRIDGTVVINKTPYKWADAWQRPSGYFKIPTLLGSEGQYDLYGFTKDERATSSDRAGLIAKEKIVAGLMGAFSSQGINASLIGIVACVLVVLAGVGVYLGISQKIDALNIPTQTETPDPDLAVFHGR